MHFVSVKHGSVSIWNVAHSTFDIEAESCLTVTNCDFRTFRVKESFWAKQQSCITLKVSLRKWCPFFVFVCFSGCHFTKIAISGSPAGSWPVFFMFWMYLIVVIDKTGSFFLSNFIHYFLGFSAQCSIYSKREMQVRNIFRSEK